MAHDFLKDIHNMLNACQHREYCRSLARHDKELRQEEREAVMRVVRRHVHSSHFIRIEAAVREDAEVRVA